MGHCMCFGDPKFVFREAESELGTVTLHHGESIRWEPFFWNAALAESEPILDWLSARGMHGARQEFDDARRRRAEYRAAADRWREAMPPVLRELHDPRSWDPSTEGSPEVADALERHYPDPTDRARVLFEWFGRGKGPWSGYPAYESVPETCLLELPLDALVRAAQTEPSTDALLEGAARFFAGWDFRKQRKKELRRLPADLKRVLLEHCVASADEGKRRSGTRAFAD